MENAKLTIQEGTTIQGRSFLSGKASALIVKPGGTIMAEGTAAEPITFTGEIR